MTQYKHYCNSVCEAVTLVYSVKGVKYTVNILFTT